jgi:hypothetical protein
VAFSFAPDCFLVVTKKNPATDSGLTVLNFSGFRAQRLVGVRISAQLLAKKNTLLKKRAACDGRTVL